MKKIVKIKGMTCAHCQQRVQTALDKLPDLKAEVNHKKGQALITVEGAWNEEAVKEAITSAGYEVVSVNDRKGLFGLL